MFNIGGIEFNVKTNIQDLAKSLKTSQKQFETLGKATKETGKLFKQVAEEGTKVAKGLSGLAASAKVLGTSLGAAVIAGGKFAAVMGGPLLLALSGLELIIGKAIISLGTSFVEASQRALDVGLEFEELNFGLKTAVDAYAKSTGNASLNVDTLIASMNKLQKSTGVSSQEIQQAQLVMLEMSRTTGLTNVEIDKLIERAAEFSVVAKQDFINVIIAMDNAFIGLPQRLNNMGINVTEAALDMDEGSKSAAVYKKIIEDTDFAIGKVSESFDNTLFGALDKSTAAWENLDRAVGEATLSLRGGLSRTLVELNTLFANLLVPLAGVIATFQTFGGGLLILTGGLITLSVIITTVTALMSAWKIAVAAGVLPVLTRLVTRVTAAKTAVLAYGVAQNILNKTMLTATTAQLAYQAAVLLTSEVVASVTLGFTVLLRIFIPVSAALLLGGGLWKLYRSTIGETNEELAKNTNLTRVQIKVFEEALVTFDRFKNKTNLARKEQLAFNLAVKNLNDLMPQSIILQDKENKVLQENTDALRANIEMKKQQQEVTEIKVLRRVAEIQEALVELEARKEARRKELFVQNKRFAKNATKEGVIASVETFIAGKAIALQVSLLDNIQQKIASLSGEMVALLTSVGRQQEDIASLAKKNVLKELRRLDHEISVLEQKLTLEQELSTLKDSQLSAQQTIDRTDGATARRQEFDAARKGLERTLKIRGEINDKIKEGFVLQINEQQAIIDSKTETTNRVIEATKLLKTIKKARDLAVTDIENSSTVATAQFALIEKNEEALALTVARSMKKTFEFLSEETAAAFSGVIKTVEGQLSDFDSSTAREIKRLKKERDLLKRSLPAGTETEASQRLAILSQQDLKEVFFVKKRSAERQQLELALNEEKNAALTAQSNAFLELKKAELREQAEVKDALIRRFGERENSVFFNFKNSLETAKLTRSQIEAELKDAKEAIAALEKIKTQQATIQSTVLNADTGEGVSTRSSRKTIVQQLTEAANKKRLGELKLNLQGLEQTLGDVERQISRTTDPFRLFFEAGSSAARRFQEDMEFNQNLFTDFVDKITDTKTEFSVLGRLNREALVLEINLERLEQRQKFLDARKKEAATPDFQSFVGDRFTQAAKTEAKKRTLFEAKQSNADVTAAKKQLKALQQEIIDVPLRNVVSNKSADLDILQARQENNTRILRAEADLLNAEADLLDARVDKEEATNKNVTSLRLEANQKNLEASDAVFAGLERGLKQFSESAGTGFQVAQSLALQTAQAMQQSFQDFFFDAFSGKMSSLKDTMRGFLQFTKDILAKVASQLLVTQLSTLALGGVQSISSSPVTVGKMNGGLIRSRNFMTGGAVVSGNPGVFGDTVPANLSDGEFVLKRQAVRRAGLMNLQSLNEGGDLMPRVVTGSLRDSNQTINIMNVVDPAEVSRFLKRNPKVITNIVSSEILRNGPVRTSIRR